MRLEKKYSILIRYNDGIDKLPQDWFREVMCTSLAQAKRLAKNALEFNFLSCGWKARIVSVYEIRGTK